MRNEMMNKLTVVVCLLLGSIVSAATPGVLEIMPSDAALVIATQPLGEVGGKVDMLAHQYSILAPEEAFNPQKIFLDQFGINNVDLGGCMGVAVLDLLKDDPDYILYLPVQDAQATIETLKVTKGATSQNAAANVWELPEEPLYVMPAGKYILIAESAEVLGGVSGKAKGVKLSAQAQPIFSDNEIAAWVNVTSLSPALQKMIAQMSVVSAATEAGQAGVETNNTGAEADKAVADVNKTETSGSSASAEANPKPANDAGQGSATVLSQQAKNDLSNALTKLAIERLIDLDEAAIGIKCLAKGFTINTYARAKAGTPLASVYSNHSEAALSELKNLPGGDFNFAGVVNVNAESLKPILLAMIDSISGNAELKQKLGDAKLAELKTIVPQVVITQGYFADYLTEGGSGGADGVPQKMMLMLNTSDSGVQLKTMQQAAGALNPWLEAVGTYTSVEYKPGAGTASEKGYDEVVIDFSRSPMSPEQKQMLMMQMGGKLSVSYLLCGLDKGRIMVSSDKRYLPEFISFAPGEKPGIDQNAQIVETEKNLPAKANMYMFFNLANTLKSMMSRPGMSPMMFMMMGPLTQLPGTIGASMTYENGYFLGTTYIPGELVQAAASFLMQMRQMQQMQQESPGGIEGVEPEGSPEPEGPIGPEGPPASDGAVPPPTI